MIALSFPFLLAPGGRLATTSRYEEIVRGQVIDALMTNQAERVMRPDYGCDIQAALFDPSDELVRRDAASIIQGRLQTFAPRAIVRHIDVLLGDAPGYVIVRILYKPSLYATEQNLTLPVSSEFLNRGRLDTPQGVAV